MKPILEIQNISKKFRIHHETRQELSLRDSIMSIFKPSTATSEEFYALKDVSFNVNAGECIGIIGKNGAGKSTLLKILSKITPPTNGKIIARGRIASLLEVGTGFHSELSGRENIFLNGCILGMKKSEIQKNLDAIVDFSGVEKFIDTPLKHYSSGMQLRLAFAVAAHLEPEILIIDEVLAVGDAEFQKKCLGKMKDVARQGRTVLFVSHNMGAINSLCPKSILLERGLIKMLTSTSEVFKHYLHSTANNLSIFYENKGDINYIGDDTVSLLKLQIIDKNYSLINTISVSDKIGILIEYEIKNPLHKPVPNFLMSTQSGDKVFMSICNTRNFNVGIHKAIAWLPDNFLNDMRYTVTFAITSLNPLVIHLQHDFAIDIIDDITAPTRSDYMDTMHGVIRPYIDWEI